MVAKKKNKVKVICYVRTGYGRTGTGPVSDFVIYDFSTQHMIQKQVVFPTGDLMIDCEYKAIQALARYLNLIQIPSNCHIYILTGDKRAVEGIRDVPQLLSRVTNPFPAERIKIETREQLDKLEELGNDVDLLFHRFNIITHME